MDAPALAALEKQSWGFAKYPHDGEDDGGRSDQT
jgi:hypothetical protein